MSKRAEIETPAGSLPGLVYPEDEKAYHARSGEFMSSHQLRDFRRCPELFHRQRAGLIPRVDKPAWLVGRAAHCLIIEGKGAFDARYMTGGPVNPKTGKPYGADTKAHAEWASQQTREVITGEQMYTVERMADAVTRHDLGSRLFTGGVGEGVARAEYGGVPCQVRLDYLHPTYGIVDLKTTDEMDWFESDARKYGYLHQLAFYRGVLAVKAGGIPPATIPCHLAAVEKSEPFRCGIWLVAPALLDDLDIQNIAALDEFASCEITGIWPTRYEERRTFYAV
ncbi:MAG: PD-(D/E)XK nuclease-like domain-containing protein [Planctomycetes bacterium]|nr:PD-(D/E)XK nuclease-like domain-containing protein [Planctomycetota bacterium]